MAAPMQHMAAAGQFMPQQQNRYGMGGGQSMDMSQFVYQSIVSNTGGIPPGGWQNGVPLAERVRNVQELISNMVLANPESAMPRQQIAAGFLRYELEAFSKSPDKGTYDHRIRSKVQELVQKRQNQAGQLQEAMNLQARQQMMLQQQQQQQQQQNAALMRAQMGRGGGPGQQGFQHLQNPMQLSQLPQQAPKMGLSLSNGMTPQMNPGQPGFPMPGGPHHAPNQLQLSESDRARVQEEAVRMMQEAGPQGRKAMNEQVLRSMGPQAYHRMQSEGKHPLQMAFYHRALKNLFPQMQQQQRPGMPPNPQGMPMQPGQQRPMNPNMMNNMGQPGGQMPFGSNLESIINEQKQGMLAERQGQMVVPASSGPGHSAASQPPLGGVQPQNMFPQTPGQTPRPQMPNGFEMQQQQQALLKQHMAQSQAQIQARQQAAANLQGQPGGLGGPMPVSQTPAMNTLNAPVGQPPVAMGQMPGAQAAPGNPPLGPGLDARFNQPGLQGSIPGIASNQDPILKSMLASLTPEQHGRLRVMSKQQVEEFFQRWKVTQGLIPGRPGQPQPGLPMNSDQTNPAGMPMQQANGALPPNVQAMLRQQNQNRLRQANAMANPQAMMDSMDVPMQVFTAIPSLPKSVTKWSHFKLWIQSTNTIPDQMKAKLRNLQVQQFMQARQNMMGPGGRGPGADPQQPGVPRPPVPASVHQIEVTPEEMQKIRASNPKIRELPDEHVRNIVQSYKFNTMLKNGNQALGFSQAQPHQSIAPPSTQPGGPSRPAGVPPGFPQGQPNPVSASAPEPTQNASVGVPGKKANQPSQQGKPVPPNPSPATTTKNLKRPNSDDLEAPTQPTAGVQRPPSQTVQQPMGNGLPNAPPNPTEAQLASLSPEQRQAWERKRHMQKQVQEFALFYKNVAQEEARAFDSTKLQEVPVPDHAKDAYKMSIMQIAQGFVRVSHPNVLMKWYGAVRDEARLRMFVKWRLRLIAHFEDGDKLQAMKDRVTISPPEIGQCKALLASVFQEMKQFPKPADQQHQQQNQPASKPAPALHPNEANSVKAAQVHNKLPQRPNSRGVQPPAAPTSAQPPFSFGAHSPDGKPVWAAPTPVTQDNLQLPRDRKRVKTGPHTSSPAGNSQNASPQTTKATSPDLKKQEPKATPKQPTFPCTVPDCEMGGPTFDSEASRKQHHEEFHVLPFQNPQQFLEQCMAEVYEHVNQARPDAAAAIPGEASMKQQRGVPGGPAAQGAKPGDGKVAVPSKPSDNGSSGQAALEPPQQQSVNDFGLANGTIDPQSLFAPAFNFDPMLGGVISNPTIYRSTSPNEDTPESSKDSGASEPNSDIHEATSLDIEMNFAEFDGGQLLNLNFGGGTDPNFETITDDMLVDMDSVKPFQPLDMSLYEWNC